MIPARHKRFFVAFFDHYSRWMIRGHFRKVDIIPRMEQISGPVLLIGNHFSWWDGFIACYLNREVFHKKLHIMMLEKQLRPRMFLNKAGAYSIRKGSRDMLRSLQYTAELLHDRHNLVVMYPQGEFQSLHAFPLRFERGMGKILALSPGEFQIVFYAALIDYFEHRKPGLTLYLHTLDPYSGNTTEDLESAYNVFLSGCIARQKP
jgi:hypothetical protein